MTFPINTAPGMNRVEPGSGAVYPAGTTNINWFGLFNSLSWNITLGTPTILYVKSLGAGATVLGVVAALTPLLVILQIPGAHLLARVGYRRAVFAGWGLRTPFIFVMAAVPLLTGVPAAGKIAMIIGCLLGFNTLRGLASGAWLPWVSGLIPVSSRGRFLSRDQVFQQIGSLLGLLLAALCVMGNPKPWQFSLAFVISGTAAVASLGAILRIPEVTAAEVLRLSGRRVPWKQMLVHPPFLKLVIFGTIWALAAGGLGVFAVAFLRGVAGYPDSLVLVMSSLAVIGALASLGWVGRLIDRVGSVPVLRGCLVSFFVMTGGWALLASGVVGRGVPLTAGLFLLWGVSGANFVVANNRLLMGTVPVMGRNHFFALHSVITNLMLGAAPIGWGILLDTIGHVTGDNAERWLNRYTIYFVAVMGVIMATGLFTLSMRDPAGESVG